MNDSYPELGPFATLYERWQGAYPDKRDPSIEAQLAETYREAWHAGGWMERAYILNFIYAHKDQASADLIIEGLKSSDPRVASGAATIASVTNGRIFDLGPDLRPAFRALVRRFPENDTLRPRDLYGHEEGDEDDSATRPFVNLYEDWRVDDYPGNTLLRRQLIDTYREAWSGGDSIDRAFVLHFLPPNARRLDPERLVDGRDLVIEALNTQDPILARTAAFTAWAFLDDGVDLGSDTREILEAHRERFPEHPDSVIWGALRALENPKRR